MARPSNVSRLLSGDLTVNLNPKMELEALELFKPLIAEAAEAYKPYATQWRKERKKVTRGKKNLTDPDIVELQAFTKEKKEPLLKLLRPLIHLISNISEGNKEVAYAYLQQDLKKKPHVVQAIISIPKWNKLKKSL